jgi:hypothetical protein
VEGSPNGPSTAENAAVEVENAEFRKTKCPDSHYVSDILDL